MIATDFEFNGIKASDVNLIIVNFGGPSREGVVSSGSKITFNSSKAINSKKWNFPWFTLWRTAGVYIPGGKN